MTIDYASENEFGQTQIALVPETPYSIWAEQTSGLSGLDAAFDADANGDGISNGMAFFLRAKQRSRGRYRSAADGAAGH